MTTLTQQYANVLILLLITITFGYSALEKTTDFKQTLHWLESYFAKKISTPLLKITLYLVMLLEYCTSVLGIYSTYQLCFYQKKEMALYTMLLAYLVLLILLIGQRIAKDYDGARNIVIYMLPIFLSVYWLTH